MTHDLNCKIINIFLTGVDEYTNLDKLLELTKKFPNVVWGVLISHGRQGGTDKRYPSYDFIEKLKTFIINHDLRKNFGIHICGKELINDFFVSAYDANKNILNEKYFQYFEYVQLNFNTKNSSLYKYALHMVYCVNRLYESKIIIQYNENNKDARFNVSSLHGNYSYFYDLIDYSGGNGVYKTPTELLKEYHPYERNIFGIAGGFGPDNIENVIIEIENYIVPLLAQYYDYKVWIDMESKLRTDNIFDLSKCEYILEKYLEIGKYNVIRQQ